MAHRVTPATQPRLSGLDAARAIAMVSVIAVHATLSFLPGPPVWLILDSHRAFAAQLPSYVLRVYPITLFYVLAGFSGRLVLERLGPKPFLVDRAKRILAPLAIFWVLMAAGFVGALIWYIRRDGGHVPHNFPAPPLSRGSGPSLGHLWFLYVILYLYAATLALRAALARIDPAGRLRTSADRALRRVIESPVAALVFGAPYFVCLAFDRGWLPWEVIPTPDTLNPPDIGTWAAYLPPFLVGWMIHRQPALFEVWTRRWAWNLAVAVALTVASLALLWQTPMVFVAADDRLRLMLAAAFVGSAWSWTFAIIGLCGRFLAAPSRTVRYLSDASYWVYLAHFSLVALLQVAVGRLDWPWWAKYPVILGVTLGLLLIGYQIFVRYTAFGGLINGRRFPRPTPRSTPSGFTLPPRRAGEVARPHSGRVDGGTNPAPPS